MDEMEKYEMDDRIRPFLTKKDLRGSTVVTRKGSPMIQPDLIKVSAHQARALVVLAHVSPNQPKQSNTRFMQKAEINEKNIGYVLPAKIKDDDIKKFSNYCKNTSLIAKQGENALNIAKTKYATDTAVRKYNKIFKDCI